MIPIQTRDGVPLCPDMGCGTPMVQVAEPSESYPGGQWQCPVGKAELDVIENGLRSAFDRLANQ